MPRSWLLMPLFACGTAPAPARPPSSAVVVVAPPCRLQTQHWRGQPTALAMANGTPFVEVLEVSDAQVVLADTATATLRTRAITVTGGIAGLRLHAAAPFVVGGYAVPGPKVPMRYVSAARGKVTVELAVQAAQLRGERACTELALDDTAGFDPRIAIEAATESEAYVHADRAVPLSLGYGEPPIATLRFAGGPKADVLAKRGDAAHVAIYSASLDPAEDVMVVGWVPQSVLHTNGHGFGGSWATEGNRSPGRERPVPGTKVVSCATDVPLEVALGGEQQPVGAIAANAIIEVLPDDSIRIRDSGVELAQGARWRVPNAALDDCVTRP